MIFPPLIRETFAPAFIYNGTCKVYFSFSSFNTSSDIKQGYVQVTVTQQKTNKNVLKTDLYPSGIKLTNWILDANRTTDDKYYIEIPSSDIINNGFKLNEYYKIQIRFTDSQAPSRQSGQSDAAWINANLSYFSEWSTVALVYGISTPTITLENLIANETTTWNKYNAIISGEIKFNRPDKETLKTYKLLLYDNSENLLEDSQEQIPVSKNQINYILKYNLQTSVIYTLKLQIITAHLYFDVIEYNFTLSTSSDTFEVRSVTFEPNNSSGSIKITLEPKAGGNGLTTDDTVTIRRASIKTNFNYWEIVDTLIIESNLSQVTNGNVTTHKQLIWEDFSIEPGILYKYQIIKNLNKTGQKIVTPDTICGPIYTEDTFLDGDGKQLKLRFDPQLSTFNIKTSFATIETIGSQYPYIRQNGNLYYKTFSLSGTITHFMDIDRHLFTTTESEINQIYKTFKNNNNITPFNDYIKEKQFRDEVIKFLYSNSVKLFRSLTQGNILIKLMNISLTPNNTLSRMIYSFSAEAIEIDECSSENCLKYNTIVKNKIEKTE